MFILIFNLYFETIFKMIYWFIFRERGREKERETAMWGCPSFACFWGRGPQHRHVPWPGIKPVTLWFVGWHSTHWARAILRLFIAGIKTIWKSQEDVYSLKNNILFILRDRGREKEVETHWCERETLIGCFSCAPQLGTEPQPRQVPWPGIKPVTLHFAGPHPTNWATWSGWYVYF